MMPKVIEALLEQLRLIGLFTGVTGRFEQELDRVRAIWDVTNGCATVWRNEASKPKIGRTAVVYNPSRWHTDQLCGYVGTDLEISASDLLASRLELWLIGLRKRDQCKNHFLKCALWYNRNHENDPASGLS